MIFAIVRVKSMICASNILVSYLRQRRNNRQLFEVFLKNVANGLAYILPITVYELLIYILIIRVPMSSFRYLCFIKDVRCNFVSFTPFQKKTKNEMKCTFTVFIFSYLYSKFHHKVLLAKFCQTLAQAFR